MAVGQTRRTLLSLNRVELFAPACVGDELVKHAPRIARRAGLSTEVVLSLIEDLLSRVSIVQPQGYRGYLNKASSLAERAGALGDEDYIALALALDAPIWTLDKDFGRIAGIRTINRVGVEALERGR